MKHVKIFNPTYRALLSEVATGASEYWFLKHVIRVLFISPIIYSFSIYTFVALSRLFNFLNEISL